jgi:hypothetical protein
MDNFIFLSFLIGIPAHLFIGALIVIIAKPFFGYSACSKEVMCIIFWPFYLIYLVLKGLCNKDF